MTDPKKEQGEKEANADLEDIIRRFAPPIHQREERPEFKLKIKPDRCLIIRSDELMTKTCSTTLTVTNNTDKRQAVQISCRAKGLFDVNPIEKYMDPNATGKFEVSGCLKYESPLRSHYISIYHIAVKDIKLPAMPFLYAECVAEKMLPFLYLHSDNIPYYEKIVDQDLLIRRKAFLIPNKEGEPKFHLKINPDTCVIFRSKELLTKPCIASFNVTNTTVTRQALKIKCTSNEFFRVNPPLAFVEPTMTVTIEVSCCLKRATAPQCHYLSLCHVSAEERTKTPVTAWTPDTKPEGVKRLLCIFLRHRNLPYFVKDPNEIRTRDTVDEEEEGHQKRVEHKRNRNYQKHPALKRDDKLEEKKQVKDEKKEEVKEEKNINKDKSENEKKDEKKEGKVEKKEEKKPEPKKEEKKTVVEK